ncbi:3-phenylpropionate_cinnamic acid dioxygenase ferredoxin--NAD(+) reductase component [Streptomyces sp. enrichment culture]
MSEVTDGGVRLADGEQVEPDEVLVAVGSLPNTEWLADSGLPVGDGVLCDRYCEAVRESRRPQRAGALYAAGDVARWDNPLFGTPMRIEHRTNAAELGMAAARNLLAAPEARKPFAPVPYFWSDQYDMRIQAYGHLRGHDEVAVVEGDVSGRRFVAAYRRGERLVGALAVGMPPKSVRTWRQAVAVGTTWREAVGGAGTATA